ncbi:MAG TPA: translation initiation factor IF-2 [Candidatus Dormibacteraeota bacterium]|nr:translation initiation factor IF-2 [Candidatus Dormibacteraeota bacterium]
MSKVRINDLARELEVKSKAILDALPLVGVTEKKTHSSSLEEHEAEKVRAHIRGSSEAQSSSARSARTLRGEEEIKTKIDLSHISRPGDVLRAITQKKEAAAAPPVRPAAPSIPPRPAVVPPAAKAAAPAMPPAPVAAPVPPVPVARPVVTPPVVEKPEAPPAPVAPVAPAAVAPPARPVSPPAAPPAVVVPPAAAPPAISVVAPPAVTAPPVVVPRLVTPPVAATPQPPAPRMIVPQTGPRPVYKAPPPRPAPPAPVAQAGAPVGTMRPAPGRPVPGQPIFQRPRPQGPGGVGAPRPPLRPGERRPMHPTRSAPTGPRPLGVGPGGPPPGPVRPGARPGAPARRPGQRYVPRGVKEGPMKGYTPPPRMVVSNEPMPITRNITITEGISVKDLAEKLDIRAKDLISRLLSRGVFATINQTLDAELASEMARFFGADTNVITFEEQASKDIDAAAGSGEDTTVEVSTRPPVVTIMGHVDHGKTTLLDSIRLTNVAEGEAGGITQHIGAYKVRITDKDSPAFGREIVFLDTPGHEAFTRMRSRGAKATDIVVLVVAADDGVMPQTLEAIDHAHAAEVPIIVAVNKIDKPDALPDRVKKQLADRGLVPEEWGGKTVFVDVSAKKKTNLNLLMEMICLVADLAELKATPERAATGVVLEAKLDRGRGPVATVLVQNGTLSAGDNFVVGNVYGKVRAMFDDRGAALETAPPSTPVEILGMEGLPQAGDQFVVVADRDKARGISEYREQKAREAALAKSSRVSLEGLAEQIKTAGTKELNIILKGDVGGSVEVLSDLLAKLSNDKVRLKLLRSGVGAITETDVLLASASNAIIIGFNVRPERKAQELAEQEEVDIRLHSIIYELQDEIKRAMSGLLEPTIKETYQGRAEVLETFRIPKVGTVAGCRVIDGLIKRDADVRLLRDNVVVFKGKIGSLRRFKDDAKEVTNGMECGISIANYGDIKAHDVIEAFVTTRVAAEVIA